MIKYIIIIAILLIPVHANNKLEGLSKRVSETTSLYENIYTEKSIRNGNVPSKLELEEYLHKVVAVYGLDYGAFYDLIQCESSWDINAKNPNSSAYGLSQYLIGTWEETDSFKRGVGRDNPYASIREMAIDIANGEEWRWQQCLDITGIQFYN